MNIARIKAHLMQFRFVDDGTAIINPDNGPLPVTMVSFNASLFQDNKVKLEWSTSMEINCSKYKIERSFDGSIFTEVASVSGSGTTSLFHSYSVMDDASSAKVP